MPRVSKAHALNAQGRLKNGCRWGAGKRPLCDWTPKRPARKYCRIVKVHGVRRVLCWNNTTGNGIATNKPAPKRKAATKKKRSRKRRR